MADASSTKIIKSQGSAFLTNTGLYFNVEKISIPVILKHSINPYYVQVKERVSGNLFQEYPTYTVWNPAGEKDEKLSMAVMRMCDNLIDADSGMRTNLFMHCQAAWSNGLYDFGGALFEPIWADMPINGVNWKGLYALKQLPSDTFRLLPEGFDKTPAQIMKGVVIGTDGKIHYYQYQDDNKFYEIQNILHIKSPQSRDLAGDALSWPVIPVIEMLNFCLDIRRQKGKRVGAPSLFVEMLSDDEDTLAVATDIITNWDSGTQFAHDENIRVYNLGIGDNGTIEDAIKSLESLLDSLYNPAAMIQKEGTRIGGSDQGAERLIYAQANKFMGWIDLGFSTLLQRWLDINGFVGYTAGISFPKLEVDKTLLNLQTAKEGYEDKSLTLDERRVLRGHEPADDETRAKLAEEYAVSAPEIPIDATIQNSSVQKKNLNIQNGGLGSGNFGHAGRPGEIGGSGGGGGSVSYQNDVDIAYANVNYIQEQTTSYEVRKIAKDIAENGWKSDPDYPVVLMQDDDNSYTVIDGNHRVKAAIMATNEYDWEGEISAVVIQESKFKDIIDTKYDGEIPEENLGELADDIRDELSQPIKNSSVQNSNPQYKPNPALPIAEQTAEELRAHNRKLETHIYSALGIKAE